MNHNHNLFIATAGGTIACVVPRLVFTAILTDEIVKTALLAAFGAAVSFVVSLLLRCLVERFRRQ